jgi:hypothetical protein
VGEYTAPSAVPSRGASDPDTRMTHWWATRAAAGVAALCAVTVGFVTTGLPAPAQSGCASHLRYSALASAEGVRSLQSFPGLTIVTAADENVVGAQAQLDSVTGSLGWAGAAYSSTVADNVGQAKASPNDLPLTVVSSYPTNPNPERKSAGAATIEAKSGASSSTARSVVGGATSEEGSSGHIVASASASCADDGALHAVADNTAEAINFSGVLRIGSVRSHAKVLLDIDNQGQPKPHLEAAMGVDGVTVLGQPAAITDKGVVVASSGMPTPTQPLSQALVDAGITVRYVAAVKDVQRGEAFAPGLEIIVATATPGVGSGQQTTTYTFGRAYARSMLAPGSTLPDSSGPAPTGQAAVPTRSTPPASTTSATASTASIPTRQVAALATGDQRTKASTTRIRNWSIAPAYWALAIGTLLLVAVRLLYERFAMRFRWT